MSRDFSKAELAFFAVPRTWKEIEMRFGMEAKTEEFRDCIILADDEGGAGHLHYLHPKRSWVLTDTAKALVGQHLITRELRVYPDSRVLAEQQEAGDAFNDVLTAFSELVVAPGPAESPTASYKCEVCGTKSLGSSRCVDPDCPTQRP